MYVIEPRLYAHVKSVVCQDVIYKTQLKNIMELPLPLQCALNSSSAQTIGNKKGGLPARIALEIVSGFKSGVTRSGKSAATFQLRKNNLLGCVINLRGTSLYSFLDQFISVASPFVLSEKINNGGLLPRENSVATLHYNVGSKDFASFPGLQAQLFLLSNGGGFNCTLCTSSSFSGEYLLLCTAMQIPI